VAWEPESDSSPEGVPFTERVGAAAVDLALKPAARGAGARRSNADDIADRFLVRQVECARRVARLA
jgi:hypothetical protein